MRQSVGKEGKVYAHAMLKMYLLICIDASQEL